MFASIFLAAALLDPLGMLVHRLPKGLAQPTAGARCGGSMTTLGALVGPVAAPRGTVTDMWFVRYQNRPIGAIVQTQGKTYWYEDLMGAFYEQITPSNADELHMKGISIGGCFARPLSL